MTRVRRVMAYWPAAALVGFAALPFVPGPAAAIYGQQFLPLFIYAVLGLGLNVVLGYTGLFHLGIAAFFGIGAYTAAILTVPQFPFQQSFLIAVACAAVAAAAVGVASTAPTLRLRGDYLALVTMAFGLIAVFLIRNLENITAGTKGLNPVLPQLLPGVSDPDLSSLRIEPSWRTTWRGYPFFYYLCLAVLVVTYLFLGRLERSRLGRSWVALREDELAASCMGLNPARLKLSAIAIAAGLAGVAGALYAVAYQDTSGPQAYDFSRSMTAVCCVILGGLGNRPGVLLGVFLLIGYDQVLTPKLDNEFQRDWFQGMFPEAMRGKQYLKVSGWRLLIFGVILIVMMRFRPALLPEARRKHELETGSERSVAGAAPPREAAMSLLTVDRLTMRFGGITAVNQVGLAVEPGQIHSIIGPNGAGKTTVFNAITGIYDPTEGTIRFRGRLLQKPFTWRTVVGSIVVALLTAVLVALAAVNPDTLWKVAIPNNHTPGASFPWGKAASDAASYVSDRRTAALGGFIVGMLLGGAGFLTAWRRASRSPDAISQAGIARTFQNIRLFQAMTVLENLLVGMKRSGRQAERSAGELLAFVGLGGRHNELAQNLPYGDQRRLEIARALACGPELLLLDEPAAGMNPKETGDLMGLIRRIRDRGVTVLLIEHHMSLVMGISDRVAVLDHGVKICEGTPAEVRCDPKVIEAYLGKEDVH